MTAPADATYPAGHQDQAALSPASVKEGAPALQDFGPVAVATAEPVELRLLDLTDTVTAVAVRAAAALAAPKDSVVGAEELASYGGDLHFENSIRRKVFILNPGVQTGRVLLVH